MSKRCAFCAVVSVSIRIAALFIWVLLVPASTHLVPALMYLVLTWVHLVPTTMYLYKSCTCSTTKYNFMTLTVFC